MVLEKELRVLYLAGNRKSTEALGAMLSIWNLKAHPYNDILPPTRSYPLQQSHTLLDYKGQLHSNSHNNEYMRHATTFVTSNSTVSLPQMFSVLLQFPGIFSYPV